MTDGMQSGPEIHVLDRRVRLLQIEGGFRTSLDSVMLAAACPARAGDHILDIGCGVGGAGFCVLRRVDGTRLTGVDIQADHVDLARRNVELNGMQGRADFEVSDIRDFASGRTFDHVICNPPYLEAGAHTPSPSEKKATAHGHLSPSPRRGEGRGEGDINILQGHKPSPEIRDFSRDLRKNQTDAEAALWSKLRNRQFCDLKFKRQVPVTPYVADFICSEKGIVIELDGGQHAGRQSYDAERTRHLESEGYRVIRFWNNEVLNNVDGVLEALAHFIGSPSPNPLPGGRGLDKAMTLADWMDAGFRHLNSGGSLSVIHRADMADKIILGLKNRFGAVEIIPLWPRAGAAAKRVIVRAVKDRKTPAAIHPGVVLHESDGEYTPAAQSILRGMQPIA